jgi:hypothetical protein
MQVAGLLGADRQRDRDTPDQAAGQIHILDHAVVGGLVHEAGQRAERTIGDQPQVRKGDRAQSQPLQTRRPIDRRLAQGAAQRAIDQRAAVRGNMLERSWHWGVAPSV